MFVKFTEIGDTVTGEFVEYQQDVPSRYGDECNLILKNNSGPKSIRCPKKLKQIIEDNLDAFVEGSIVTVTFTDEIDTGKGNPMKDFDVDVEPPKTRGKGKAKTDPAPAPADDDAPF